MKLKTSLLHVSTALALGLLTAAVMAAEYPDKPIKLIVPTTAGSTPDVVARFIGVELAAVLGQPIVIDNRPGAIGTIGLNAVAKAAPDGYTLGVQTMPYIVAPSLLAKLPYDSETDLLAVAQVLRNYSLLVVPAASSIHSMADIVDRAKARPGQLKFASSGNATPSHLAFALLQKKVGIDLQHIPYKGTPPVMLALLASEIDMAICGLTACAQQIAVGKLRPLATAAPHRLPAYPKVPTLTELGYGVEITDWLGVVAPAGTPREIVDKLHAALAKVVAMPEIRQRLEAVGMEPASTGPEAFAALIHSEILKWKAVVRDARITVD